MNDAEYEGTRKDRQKSSLYGVGVFSSKKLSNDTSMKDLFREAYGQDKNCEYHQLKRRFQSRAF